MAPSTRRSASPTARLAAQDWVEISNTLARYCHTSDSGNAEGWARCFTDDGLFEESFADRGVVTRLQGRSEMVRFASAARQAIPHSAYARHWSTNLVIEADGDRARARCYVKFVNTLDEGSVIVTGRYLDVLSKVDGEWLIQQRQALLDQTEAEASARMEKLARQAKAAGKAYHEGTGAYSSASDGR